jgi:transposase
LNAGQRAKLEKLAGSRTAALREVERAKVLLAYAQGQGPTEIQRTVGVSRPAIYKCIDKALAGGVEMGLHDRYHRPRAPQISDEAKAWVVELACRKPRELGLAAGRWTLSALAATVASRATDAGFPRLAGAGKTTVWRILKRARDQTPSRPLSP